MKPSKKEKQETLSMKDALSSFKGLKVIDTSKQNRDWRDPFWNYPLFLVKLFKSTKPFSFIVCFSIIALCLASFLQSQVFGRFMQNISYSNDTYTEGMVGAISSFNPLFVSANYVDKAVDSLVFDKFIGINKDGNPIPEIAKTWSVSSDNLVYTFVIADNIHWQDGSLLTVDDVLFTFDTAVSLAKDYKFDSVGAALDGVQITKIDDHSVQFTLKDANPTFFEAISVYIVPQAVLGKVALTDMPFDAFARTPLGSGKYIVERTEQNAVFLVDNPYDQYNPQLKNLIFRIYPDYQTLETAFRVGDINAVGSWDSEALLFMKDYSSFGVLTSTEKFRDRMIFFNVRKDDLKDKNVRIGLSYLLNKNELLEKANIMGEVMQGPYSASSWVFNNQLDYYNYDPSKASTFLNNVGYTKNATTGYYESSDNKILSFTLSYLGNDTNDRIVKSLIDLYDKEGVIIKPDRLDYNQITQQVIATRNFELLLYEVETTVDPDRYNLWHSLKTNYPDLNLSGYGYERVDILLEDARKTVDKNTRKTKYTQFQKYLMADAPALFLYHPDFVFYFDEKLKGIDIDDINFSYNRYWNIENWYWSY